MSSSRSDLKVMFSSFEDRCFKFQGVDAWQARDIMDGLGYANWQNFREAIRRAWQSASSAGNSPEVNFLVSDGSRPWHPDEVFTEASKNPQGGRPTDPA